MTYCLHIVPLTLGYISLLVLKTSYTEDQGLELIHSMTLSTIKWSELACCCYKPVYTGVHPWYNALDIWPINRYLTEVEHHTHVQLPALLPVSGIKPMTWHSIEESSTDLYPGKTINNVRVYYLLARHNSVTTPDWSVVIDLSDSKVVWAPGEPF